MDKVDRIKEQWAMYAERWKSFSSGHVASEIFPDQGLNPCSCIHWERRIFTIGPPGKSREMES